jgi:hypothetical protein
MRDKKLKLLSFRSLIILCYILIVAFIPLAARLREIEFISPLESWYRLASCITYNFHAQFRLELLIVITSTLVIAAILKYYYYEYDQGVINTSYLDCPIIVFAGLAAVSALTSPYINIAFWGFNGRSEGLIAYLAYVFIFSIAANFVNGEQDKRIIFGAILVGGLIHSIIGIGQFLGINIWETDFGQRLFIPSEFLAEILAGEAKYGVSYSSKASGLTYNPNYFGGYMAMLFPMAFVLFIYANSKKQLLVSFILLVFFSGGLLAPTSAGALAAVTLTLVIFFILTFRDLKYYYKKLIVLIVIGVLLIVVLEQFSGGAVSNKIKSVYSRTMDIVKTVDVPAEKKSEILAELPIVAATDRTKIEVYDNPWDSFATNRGYLWRKSVEMIISNNLLLGDGFDTFPYNFPHYDAERDIGLFSINSLIDKPHNTYIQIGLSVGFIGLLVYLYIMGKHFVKYVNVFKQRGIKTTSDIIMLSLFMGWLGYLFQGISNDSVLSNAPVFWATFGLSVNYVHNHLNMATHTVTDSVVKAKGKKKRHNKVKYTNK